MATIFSPKSDRRCPCCYAEWVSVSLHNAGIKGCPKCKTVLEPLDMAHDGYIEVNWEDVRMLVLFAKRWSKLFDMRTQIAIDAVKALDNIVKKVQGCRPQTGRILVPEQDTIAIETFIQASTDKEKIVNVRITHKGDGEELKIISPYFHNIQ